MVAGTCWDTVGYFEPVTGHTCQTYIDYGFCNGTNILTGSAIDSQLAQQNCCSCGKSLSRSFLIYRNTFFRHFSLR